MKRVKDVHKLGQVLRKARTDQDITFKRLNEISGVSEGGISGLEQGEYQKVDPAKLRALATALHLNSRDLFELAGLLPDEELPSLRGLLQTQYRSLPEDALTEIDNFVDYQLTKHGIDPDPPGKPDARKTRGKKK